LTRGDGSGEGLAMKRRTLNELRVMSVEGRLQLRENDLID
jgi:hypothetical protein